MSLSLAHYVLLPAHVRRVCVFSCIMSGVCAGVSL